MHIARKKEFQFIEKWGFPLILYLNPTDRLIILMHFLCKEEVQEKVSYRWFVKEQVTCQHLPFTGCLSVLISCPKLSDPTVEHSSENLSLISALNLKMFGLGFTGLSY